MKQFLIITLSALALNFCSPEEYAYRISYGGYRDGGDGSIIVFGNIEKSEIENYIKNNIKFEDDRFEMVLDYRIFSDEIKKKLKSSVNYPNSNHQKTPYNCNYLIIESLESDFNIKNKVYINSSKEIESLHKKIKEINTNEYLDIFFIRLYTQMNDCEK